MKVIVIGAGLIGVTTAHRLRQRGHEVTVLDREEGPGRETSFANGALLTPSMSQPWNAPGSWRVLMGSLGHSDAALQLHLRILPSMMGWGVQFLRNSRPAAFERNALSNLRLSLYSLSIMESLRQALGLEYGRSAFGTLRIFRDRSALDAASAKACGPISKVLSFRRLSTTETVEFEPALAAISAQLAGALHYPSDEAGDAHRFCVALAEEACHEGVEFCFRTEVKSLELHAGRVAAVRTQGREFFADRYVVAAGSYSTGILKRIGTDLPVQPAKGYSITFPSGPSKATLRVPIVDDRLHAVVVPLEGVIRVAGTAEFAGYDRQPNLTRIKTLVELLRQILPNMDCDLDRAMAWNGLRAMSADGVPIIGPTPVLNLFVNTGHGHLGWTMAAGSAQLLSDLISGVPPSIDPSPYSLKRFA